MGNVISMRDKMINKIVQELKQDDYRNGRPPEVAEALGHLMREGKINYTRREGEWAFYLST